MISHFPKEFNSFNFLIDPSPGFNPLIITFSHLLIELNSLC